MEYLQFEHVHGVNQDLFCFHFQQAFGMSLFSDYVETVATMLHMDEPMIGSALRMIGSAVSLNEHIGMGIGAG